MSPVQTVPKRTRRTLRRRSRTPRSANTAESEGAPLEHLRLRCAGGAVTASVGYLAVLTTASLRPHAMPEPVTYGLLVLCAVPAALCALGAILLRAEARHAEQAKASARQVDDIDWAIQFGARMAEAFPDYEVRNAAPRGPSMR